MTERRECAETAEEAAWKQNGRWKRIGQADISGSIFFRFQVLGRLGSSLEIERHMQAECSGLAGYGGAHDVCKALERRTRRTNCSTPACTPDGVVDDAGSR